MSDFLFNLKNEHKSSSVSKFLNNIYDIFFKSNYKKSK